MNPEDDIIEYEEVADETGEAIDALRSRSSVALPSSPALGIRRRWHNEPGGGVTVHTAQDVQAVLDRSKSFRDAVDGRRTGDFGVFVGQIPMGVYTELRRRVRNEFEFQELVHAWLEDSDNSAFRVWRGRLGKPQ